MRKLFPLLIAICFFTTQSFAQLRIAIAGGGHQSSVIETNNLSGWDSIKNNYNARTGVHFGLVADMPLSEKSIFSFQPAVFYCNKGRKYAQKFDTATSQLISLDAAQFVNYIDIPLNLVAKFGNKIRFIVGAGPYISFFYNGKETTKTHSQGGVFGSYENNDPPVGNKPGQYKVSNIGVNALAGVESGRVFLTANYSRGLNDFYQAVDYTGSFKHQVIGATLGIFIGNPVPIEKKVKDRDKDGILDENDNCPTEPGPPVTNGCPDKDADGIADKDDKCPDVAGTVLNSGCPDLDKDKDGVNDVDDMCPDVAGLVKYKGCPVPDTDKDGINDEEDKCPGTPGFARYEGCPIPDTDGDGINNEEDKCPDIRGTKETNGCPEMIKKEIIEKVNYAARRIQFKFSSADLQPASFPVLDEVVKILQDNPELKLDIEGHTSNDGILNANMKLSQDRADNVKAYMVSKGIDASRLVAKGFGPTVPVNSGRTEAEKSQNRRVELKLSN